MTGGATEATGSAAREAVAPRRRSPHLVLACTSLGTLLVILLTSGLNIASPEIRSSFDASGTAIGWVLSGYTLAFAMLSLTGGALTDRFGARRVFLAGLGVFTLFSLVAAAAPSVGLVVAGTFGEGVGAALVLPSALALIQSVYQDLPGRLSWAIGIWAGANALGAALGPVLCGALVSVASWRAMFLAVAVLAVVFALVGRPVLPRLRGGGARLDLPGLLVMVVLLGDVAFLAHDWRSLPRPVLAAGVLLGCAAVWLFARVERRSSAPMLPLSQLRDVPFSANAVVTVVGTAAFFGTLYLTSMGFQDELGMAPFVAGVALLPLAGGNIVAALAAGRVIGRLGVRGTMVLGSVLLIAALAVIPLVFGHYAALVAPLVLMGAGWGLLVPTTSAAGLARARRGKEGVASGVTAGGRELGAALAAAVLLPLGVRAGVWSAAAVGAVSLAVVLLGVRVSDRPGA
ncbi:MFS transporter [Streptomyces griseoviridis]|uniref:DHA2 family methylenomycin A resistance protein-like MFS transporter n=1 Tax=Streptomyces griseoviridis TaxID=45398 RepID=A0ABT9LQ39_STRGD|nr:MFS transporter [Streptomyces griseoviridis]MDP9685645.1 DHA2 family methylenomycin A resistance protein-like MFS transporter [Streptomyces griseoviridis]GGS88954.1 MFS transporter [Streptomyces griseoviridis]